MSIKSKLREDLVSEVALDLEPLFQPNRNRVIDDIVDKIPANYFRIAGFVEDEIKAYAGSIRGSHSKNGRRHLR